ncbi:hypothetical protein [Lysinibacillus sp. NPDC047702]|uniref:hypothetical protein n=1 Tax=unclassified Lysinibacillus TaxID=2636778 RepID=UPI003CFCB9BC
MLPGFHRSYNAHALSHILKRVDVPNASLAIAEGETLAPQNNRVHYPYIRKLVTEPDISKASFELTQIDGFADKLNQTDFRGEGWYGDPIGGI